MRSIFPKTDPAATALGCTGAFAAITQCVFFRELFTVVAGNEFSIGAILAAWLLSTGLGSLLGSRAGKWSSTRFVLCAVLAAAWGLLAIRLCRLLFNPGEAIGPIAMLIFFLIGQAPAAFCGGGAFGALTSRNPGNRMLYMAENVGFALGAGIVFILTLVHEPQVSILAIGCALLLTIVWRSKVLTAAILALLALLIGFDAKTVVWKYAGPVSAITATPEGEVATVITGSDTTILLNNTVYRSNLDREVVEQAVHIPMAQRPDALAVLVIFDRGFYPELAKYPGLHIDGIETLPVLARPGSIVVTPEQFRSAVHYDLIVLGSGLPSTIAGARYYTPDFFRHMRRMLTDTGVLAFTLPFNQQYMAPAEKKLYGSIIGTLRRSFAYVKVFPGSGATFMASAAPLRDISAVNVTTSYLAGYVLPTVTPERVASANLQTVAPVNSVARPVVLSFMIQSWLAQYRLAGSVWWFVLPTILLGIFAMLPRSPAVASIATSGMTVGFYSIAIMLLYQGCYGMLYAQIAPLLMALTLGFINGSFVRRLWCADAIIGIYCVLTIAWLASAHNPAPFWFYCAHAGIGILAGAQFVNRPDTGWGALNAADLFGGVAGMVLASTLLIPLWGVAPSALGFCAVKVFVGLMVWGTRQKRLPKISR
jgi:hypothetical protein